MARDDLKLERLTDLILVLLDASQPIPLSQLGEEIPGYPEAGEARRMAFERDKKLLREEGITVEAVAIDGPEQYGYRIDPGTFFLPDLDLLPDEQAALHLAVAGVHLADDSGGDALRKLGVVDLSDVQPVASLGVVRGLDRIFQAISTSAEVRFSYRGENRTVYPVRLRFSGGHWYLSGWSKERQAGRNFRVDRIDGSIAVGSSGSGSLGADQTVNLDAPDEPWPNGDGEAEATVLRVWVDPLYAWRVIDEVGDDRVVERREDGSVVVAVPVAREEAARSWVLSFLDHVEVLEPAEFRTSMSEWLREIIDVARSTPESVTLDDLRQGTTDEEIRAGSEEVPPTQRRLRRLLAMLEWLAGVGTVPTKDVADRFNMTEGEVVAELELAACCGRPPFSPGELMDIVVDAEMVTARLPEMSRPRQLTPAEGVAVATAARTILALPGSDADGPLSRALGKLERALGEREAVEVALPAPQFLEEMTTATEGGRHLEVEYLATSTDEMTTREIDPLRVIALEGRWYVEAFCHSAQAMRTFRVDSFKSVRDLGAQVGARHDLVADPEPFIPAADTEAAIVRVGLSSLWLADSIPVLARRWEPDGSAIVAISVSGRSWFDRILLQAGPGAVVVQPASMLRTASDAAERVLRRYGATV